MKALILAGGRGKRLEGASKDLNKCMLHIDDRPLIEYSLECASKAALSEAVVVVGYRAEDIINTYGNGYKGLRISYVIQNEQKGLVHAIECAREAIDGHDFMLMLGDEVLLNPRHHEMIELHEREDLFGVCGVVEVSDRTLISRTYSIVQDNDRRIYRLIEKPHNPPNSLMGTGNCIFKGGIFSYIETTPINQERGEKELPDLIQCVIDDGNKVKSFALCDRYVNVNSTIELEEAASCFAHP